MRPADRDGGERVMADAETFLQVPLSRRLMQCRVTTWGPVLYREEIEKLIEILELAKGGFPSVNEPDATEASE